MRCASRTDARNCHLEKCSEDVSGRSESLGIFGSWLEKGRTWQLGTGASQSATLRQECGGGMMLAGRGQESPA